MPKGIKGFQKGHPRFTSYSFPKGHIPWNKGLTKESNIKIANIGKKISEIRRKKRIKPVCSFEKGHIPWNKGGKWSEEMKKKLSEAHKGMKYSEETKKKHSRLLKEQWKNGVRKGGWKLSEETKRKIGTASKGRKVSEETKRKISQAQKGRKRPWQEGDKSPSWKGDDIGYQGLHTWVKKVLGKPTECEHCGKKNLVNSKEHNLIHWANKSGKYKRDKNDWIRLCAKCHIHYDKR